MDIMVKKIGRLRRDLENSKKKKNETNRNSRTGKYSI